MFSGKSEELIRRLTRAVIAKQRVAVFKPEMDVRYDQRYIVSHNDHKIASDGVKDEHELLEKAADSEVIGIDEAQFFGIDLVEVCQEMANAGKRVIVAGLDMDYRGKPFEPIPQLLAVAEYITKTHAICVVCGNPAHYTQRIVKKADRILLGASDIYEARCRNCFEAPSEND
jgi:thymidine kinase